MMPVTTLDRVDPALGNFPARGEGYTYFVNRPDGYEMVDPERFSRAYIAKGRTFHFDCEVGLLRADGRDFQRTYLVEIDTAKVSAAHDADLGVNSFGSHAAIDAAEWGMDLSREILRERGLRVVAYYSSYPRVILMCEMPEVPMDAPDGDSGLLTLPPVTRP